MTDLPDIDQFRKEARVWLEQNAEALPEAGTSDDEEQEVQVPRRSTRVQPYSKVVFEDDDEEQEVYEIKEIIGIQNNPISGEVQYLISWKGYTSKSNSWEPKENLVGADCPKLINKFIRNNKI